MFPDGRPDQLVRGVDIVGTPLVSLTKIVATGDTPDIFNGYCGAESGSVPVSAVAPAILISEMEVQKKETSTDKPPILPPPAHDPEAQGATPVKKLSRSDRAACAAFAFRRCQPSPRADKNCRAAAQTQLPSQAAVPETESDQTLRAMHDEMERSRTRLQLPGVDKPFYIEYRLLDLDVRAVTSSFGALISSNTTRNRFMSIDVRVGDYHLDSSNFISEDGFQGFLGTTGEVGIDRDYNSLRQDLWLSTDQAYKQAVTQMSLKQSFLRSLTKPPEIDDFSQTTPLVKIDPRVEPDWTTRNWEDESRAASAGTDEFPAAERGSRVNYYLVYVTYYLMNTEGTTIRTVAHPRRSRSRYGHHCRRRHGAAQFLRGLRRQAAAICPIPATRRPVARLRPARELMTLRQARSFRISPARCCFDAPPQAPSSRRRSLLRCPEPVRRFPPCLPSTK